MYVHSPVFGFNDSSCSISFQIENSNSFVDIPIPIEFGHAIPARQEAQMAEAFIEIRVFGLQSLEPLE